MGCKKRILFPNGPPMKTKFGICCIKAHFYSTKIFSLSLLLNGYGYSLNLRIRYIVYNTLAMKIIFFFFLYVYSDYFNVLIVYALDYLNFETVSVKQIYCVTICESTSNILSILYTELNENCF